MKNFFIKTFGGLVLAYYLRQLFFGALFGIGFLYMLSGAMSFKLIVAALINTLLYPYSRFVYESIVGFIMGNNVFFFQGKLFFVYWFVKFATMWLCWAGAFFVAPIGLIYLYFRNSQNLD